MFLYIVKLPKGQTWRVGGPDLAHEPLLRTPGSWYKILVQHIQVYASFFLRGYCTSNLKLACFVCYLKIINTFSKNNTCSLNVNEWKFHSPIEWNSCKPLKKEWFCTLNSKFPLIKSENHSKKSELPLICGVKRRTTRKRIVLRLNSSNEWKFTFFGVIFTLYEWKFAV